MLDQYEDLISQLVKLVGLAWFAFFHVKLRQTVLKCLSYRSIPFIWHLHIHVFILINTLVSINFVGVFGTCSNHDDETVIYHGNFLIGACVVSQRQPTVSNHETVMALPRQKV